MVSATNENKVKFFFEKRESTSRNECGEVARNIVGNNYVTKAVETQGSRSCNVECTTKSIVSFRQRGSILDSRIADLAKEIHGPLAPDVSYCGNAGEWVESPHRVQNELSPGQTGG
ncbi:hypothetical protein PG993_008007 [Apiospora rasikravindrae]|uniref:Uncharacterized protein n=1 Tax=Apiospora rasikravindrae TaxID=990691 RepID=A0ABR1SZ47_9PEZI